MIIQPDGSIKPIISWGRGVVGSMVWGRMCNSTQWQCNTANRLLGETFYLTKLIYSRQSMFWEYVNSCWLLYLCNTYGYFNVFQLLFPVHQ